MTTRYLYRCAFLFALVFYIQAIYSDWTLARVPLVLVMAFAFLRSFGEDR